MEKKKSLLEIILMPLIIGLVGILGTYFITRQQIKSSEKSAKSEQQIKMIEIFSEKITSNNKKDQELAVRILNTLDPELSQSLATAVFETDSLDLRIRSIASEFINKSYYIVAGSFYSLDESRAYVNKLASFKLSYSIHIYKNNRNVYAVCIGEPTSYEEATSILNAILQNKELSEAYIRISDNWGEDYNK